MTGDLEGAPDHIGGYRVAREIDRGGGGVLYEVERDGQRFALRRREATELSDEWHRRSEDDARALLQLDHPGVATVREVGSAEGFPFLVMDLVEGQSLEDRGPMLWNRAVEIGRGIGSALVAVHAAGLCHRDLRPQSVLLRDDGSPVIVDFGRLHDGDDVRSTGVGSPQYLAPEQVAGQPTDARTDVHALGLILAELLTGHPARRGRDSADVLAEAAAGGPPDLSGVASVPAALIRVIRTATARRPEWRYPTAQAMVDDLERLLAGKAVEARPPGWIASSLEALRQRRRRALGWTAGVSAVVVAVVWLLAGQLSAGRAERARSNFENAVLAWCEQDPDATRSAIDATLAEVPAHGGALTLQMIEGGAVGSWGPASPRIDSLRAGLAARQEERWQDAIAAFRGAVAADPACPLSRILLARAQEQAGDLTAAERELTTAAELLPESAALAHALGSLQSRRGQLRAAAGSYRRAAQLRPDSFSLRYRLARAYYRYDSEAALREAGIALDLLEPGRSQDRRRVEQLQAAALGLLGRNDEATVILERLAAETPDDAEACFDLAYALDRAQNARDAREWYEKALAIDPTNRSASLCLAWLLTTADQEDLRDVDRAERMLLETLERDGGQSREVLLMVRDFGLRTGRVDDLVQALTNLMARPGISAQARAALEHTRNNLRSGSPRIGR